MTDYSLVAAVKVATSAQELSKPNVHATLNRSKQLLKNFLYSDVSVILIQWQKEWPY